VYEEIGVILDKKRGIIIADGKEYPIGKLAGVNGIDGVGVYPTFFDIPVCPVRAVTKGKVTLPPEEIAKQRSLIAHILRTFSNLSEEEKKEINSWRNFLDRMERTGGYESVGAVVVDLRLRTGKPGPDGIPLDFVPSQEPILRDNKDKKGDVTQYQESGLPKSERVTDKIIEPKTTQVQTSLTNREYDEEVMNQILDEYFKIMDKKSDDKFSKEVPYSMDVVEKSDIMKSSNFKTIEEEEYKTLLSEFSNNPSMERKIEIWRQLAEMWRQDKSHSSPK
jgi:hypothetical protein